MNGCGSSWSWCDKVLIFLVLISYFARLILIYFWVFHIISPIEFYFLLHSGFHTWAGLRMTWRIGWLLKHRLMVYKKNVSDSFDLWWCCRICILYWVFPVLPLVPSRSGLGNSHTDTCSVSSTPLCLKNFALLLSASLCLFCIVGSYSFFRSQYTFILCKNVS